MHAAITHSSDPHCACSLAPLCVRWPESIASRPAAGALKPLPVAVPALSQEHRHSHTKPSQFE